jgi:hypothetical protein
MTPRLLDRQFVRSTEHRRSDGGAQPAAPGERPLTARATIFGAHVLAIRSPRRQRAGPRRVAVLAGEEMSCDYLERIEDDADQFGVAEPS